MCKLLRALVAFFMLMILTAQAHAQAPVTTASSDEATDRQITAWTADKDDVAAGAHMAASTPAIADRALHGQVEVEIGSHGERRAGLSAVAALGSAAELAVVLSDTSIRDRRGRADLRSLALGLAIGDGRRADPCGLRHTGVRLASDRDQEGFCGRPVTPHDAGLH